MASFSYQFKLDHTYISLLQESDSPFQDTVPQPLFLNTEVPSGTIAKTAQQFMLAPILCSERDARQL